jgi:hypothetical protein
MRGGQEAALALSGRLAAAAAAAAAAQSPVPTHQRYPAAATLAVSLIRGDSGFERLTRIEQRLERSIHRNLDELRRLRSSEDPAQRLEPPLRRCPFVAEEQEPTEEPVADEPVAEEAAEEAAEQEVATPAPAEKASVQNEPNALAAPAADASRDRVEYDPTSRSTGTPRAGRRCHEDGA